MTVLFISFLFFFPAEGFCQGDNFFEGLIEPSTVIKLGSQVFGTLEVVSVDRGDRVVKGQVVARLHSSVEEAAVELVRARVEFGERKVMRNEDLFKKNLISIHEKDEMETELKISLLQLYEAQEKLNIRTIKSPVDGVVVERFLSPGEYVGEDPIMEIAGIDPLYVEVIVPVEKFGTIKKGMMAEVRPEHLSVRDLKARVIIVDRVIDAASGTFAVRLELPNPKYILPAGLKCRVNFLR
ncbi:MAG: efflux RND transporter periplasmic adaptor subunit [Deltaproteobacteria bacterium]|nr:efflux RND transporter periplasmic adaptor subunit [Deltaproteobacteria bacterium]